MIAIRRAVSAVLLGASLALSFAGAALAEKRVALVIGNSAYRTVGALPNPANDAKLMKSGLEAAGFTVTLAESVGRDAFVTALRNFRDQADGADWAVVYYAGHGMEIGGTNYLIPVDARLSQDRDIAFEAIPLDQVMTAIDGAKGLRMVILDACRNNPFAQTMTRSGGAGRDVGRGLAMIEPSQATLVAYAAKAGTIAADGTGANSPYASSLAKRIAEPGLEVSKLFRLVRDDVLEATGQKQEPFTYGSLPGRQDFYFRPPQVAAVVPVAPQPQPPIPAVDPRLVEAGQVWTTIQNSTSIEVLTAFQTKYAGTVYADIAGARISELRRVAVAPPTTVPTPAPTPPPLPLVAPAPSPTPNAVACTGGTVAAIGVSTGAPALRCVRPKDTFRDCDNCPEMTVLPAGTFTMGSAAGEPGREDDEGPARSIAIPAAFAVGKLAISRGEFATFVSESGYAAGTSCNVYDGTNWKITSGKSFRDPGYPQTDAHPAVCVSWDDAKAYVAWLARKTGKPYRLLTEAEREYAERGGTSTAYWFGDASRACSFANGPDATGKERFSGWKDTFACRDGYVFTAPGGSFQPNPFGLYDIAGNVYEWTEDCYHDTYNGAPRDASAWVGSNCTRRVIRGGSWFGADKGLRSAFRNLTDPTHRDSNYGFRIARDIAGVNFAPPVQTAALTPPNQVTPPPAPTSAASCPGGLLAAVGTAGTAAAAQRCLKPKDAFQDCTNCPQMVVVPGGRFSMGSPASEARREDDEGPAHDVTVAGPFAVGKLAITFGEWDACVAGGGCNGYKPKDEGWGRGLRPVVNVSYDDAKAYVTWLSRTTGKTYRLLSEAEREYVTRAGTTTPFWWGSSVTTTQANYDGNYPYPAGGKTEQYREKTVTADSFQANPWGLYNVHGNVFEWTEDCYHETYAGAPSTAAPWTSGGCTERVLRGGSWYNDGLHLRAANRLKEVPDKRDNYIGFRVARVL
ncbi:MAG: SUMF1/EgtB/PvdO family nonheme iron enzyme [Bauldia sp.]